ncbi:MAG: D-alanyl-D-alanine carboxypeptidase family protein [Desulforhopalus sp.]
MRRILVLILITLLVAPPVWAGRAKIKNLAKDPYVSALVVEADSGKVIFEDQADTLVYPASVLKLMDLLIVLDAVEKGTVRLDDMVQVTKEASQMGGSQVYLDPKEKFSVDDLLYALMVQSANDAAVALAIHVAGSKTEFIAQMNRKAEELGMKDSRFHSVHGLPPARGQEVDQTTARDLALLCRELSRYPETFKYTGTKERDFRDGKFIMRTHNHLLKSVDGADGFKTGFFNAAGFSIAVTAKRNGVRVIALVMGSKDRKLRDAKAAELLARGFAALPAKPVASKVVATSATTAPQSKVENPSPIVEKSELIPKVSAAIPEVGGGWGMFFWGVMTGITLSALTALYLLKRRSRKRSRYLR